MRRRIPKTPDEIDPEGEYCLSDLCEIILDRGRFLREALSNDPLAPAALARSGTGRWYSGKALLAYCRSLEPGSSEAYLDLKAKHEEYTRLASELRAKKAELAKKEKDLGDKADLQEYIREEILGAGKIYNLPNAFFAANCGVYFLEQGGQIVYVGQSVNVISRVREHLRSKDFDSVTVLPCEEETLNETEGFFIRLLKPKLNGTPGPHSAKAIRLQRIFLKNEAHP